VKLQTTVRGVKVLRTIRIQQRMGQWVAVGIVLGDRRPQAQVVRPKTNKYLSFSAYLGLEVSGLDHIDIVLSVVNNMRILISQVQLN